jgi:DNA-binding CsgD family transcriptional regulator
VEAGLSETQARLLQLIREGRPAAEIAVRLGLTTTQVHSLIDGLVRHAGVADRAALRAWEPRRPARAPHLESEGAARGPAPAGRSWRGALAMAVGTLGLALVGVLLLTRLPGTGEDAAPGAVVSAPSLAPTVSALVAADGRIIGEGSIALAASDVPAPQVEFIGIASVEGSGDVLIRGRTGPEAADSVDVLFRAPVGARILNAAVSERGASISFAVCAGPRCTVPPPQAGAGTSTDILWSRDAGATFERIATLPDQAFVDVHVVDGVVVRMFTRGNPDWLRFPGGNRVPKPGFGSTPGVPLAFGTLPDRAVRWRGDVAWAFFEGRFVLDVHGRELFATGVTDEASDLQVRHFADAGMATVTWMDPAREAFIAAYREGEPLPIAAWRFEQPLRVVGTSGTGGVLVELPDLESDQGDVDLGLLSLGSGRVQLLPLSLRAGVRLRSVAGACLLPGPCPE